jgi:heme-degrading monooxygenase HmoA
MILELATFTIPVARLAEFESAFVEARKIITQADGCGIVSLQRCIETPGRYQLLVQWASVEHHMKGFRESPRFVEWRRILGPFFAAPPFVEHYELAG